MFGAKASEGVPAGVGFMLKTLGVEPEQIMAMIRGVDATLDRIDRRLARLETAAGLPPLETSGAIVPTTKEPENG